MLAELRRTRVCIGALLLLWYSDAGAQTPWDPISPIVSDRSGGTIVTFNNVRWDPWPEERPEPWETAPIEARVYFGGILHDSGGFVPWHTDPDTAETTSWRVEVTAPAAPQAGLVDIRVETVVNGVPREYNYPDAFRYVDAPEIAMISPTTRSIGPDNRTMTLTGAGFPIARPLEIWFGDQRATSVAISPYFPFGSYLHGTRVTCTPPPFPGGEYPLTVDVRVVTVGGGETVLPGAFTYQQIEPELFHISSTEFPMYTAGRNVALFIKNFLRLEDIDIYLDGELLEVCGCPSLGCLRSPHDIGCVMPPLPPGRRDITVVNPDGGTSTLPDAFLFYRTTPYHTGDTDEDGRLTLRELLRVVQFFNSSGYQCAPEGVETEDGYALGLPADAGAQECIPHDGDLETQNWQVELTELLDVIQVYAFGQYEVCEDRYQFCPAEAEEEGEVSTTDEHR